MAPGRKGRDETQQVDAKPGQGQRWCLGAGTASPPLGAAGQCPEGSKDAGALVKRARAAALQCSRRQRPDSRLPPAQGGRGAGARSSGRIPVPSST